MEHLFKTAHLGIASRIQASQFAFDNLLSGDTQFTTFSHGITNPIY
jgi:hypothetical protein